MKNFRDEKNRVFRISHDALFNLYQLSFQLKFADRKRSSRDFVTHITIHPRIIVHLLPRPLLDSLDHLLKVNSEPTMLHYDTVFNIGDFYLSTLTYRHGIFIGNPIIPCAYFIHSRRFHCDHLSFLEAVTDAVHSLLSKRVIIVTDREFKVSSIFPVGAHVLCWNHLETDLYWYLKSKCNCSPEDINYFVNVFRGLMNNCETEKEFDSEWSEVKENPKFLSSQKICQYFEGNLIPSFKLHASIWTLKNAGVPKPENGITNNPSESMNAVLHRLQQWKNVPLDVIAISLYHLSSFYFREI